jgi:uncharacterized membrane protein YccF (DUF307 family)
MSYPRRKRHHHPTLSLVWFLLVGWWLGLAWLIVALLLICTIVGAPLGACMLCELDHIALLR